MNRYARRGTIAGRMTDRDSGRPLYGVNIAVAGTDIRAHTDIRGRFTIPNVDSGECLLRCDLEGYKPVSGLRMMVAAGRVTRCDCQLVPKDKISLNEPVVLLPLRLEIRKHVPHTQQKISVAKYTLRTATERTAAVSTTSSRKFAPFEDKSVFEPPDIQQSEYWIRWYPDDIHYPTPVGKITGEERVAWEQFYQIYEKHQDLGSVKGLFGQDPFNLSLESLEIFYGISPGRLTDDEIARCKAYDEAARLSVLNEGQGVREALGWQDTENPEVKSAWIAFAKAFGPVRARQIAKDMLEGNWDFDTDIDEDEPMEILLDQGMSLPTLPEEISLYTIKARKIELLVERISINRNDLIVSPTDLEGTHWMTDFKKAVEAGMGTVISDPEKVSQIDRADWLIVVGLNDTPDSRNAFEEILRRNSANGELAILAQDSPTNNTESVATRYTGLEVAAEEYLKKTRMRIPADNVSADLTARLGANTLDSHRLTDIFKLANSTLSQMPETHLTEMTEAGAMAALLWTPCTLLFERTWGARFRQHSAVGSQAPLHFSLGEFFIHNVRARGTLPILRVGQNPYGILPAISLRDWCDYQSRHKDIAGQSTEILCAAIDSLKTTFLRLSKGTPRVDPGDNEVYDKFLEILYCAPISKRVDVRAFDSRKPYDMNQDPKFLDCALVKDKVAGNQAGVATPFPETAYLHDLSRINRTDFEAACFQIDEDFPLLKRVIKYFLWLIFGEGNEPSKCEIKGTVVDKSTGKILSGAMVTLKGTAATVETDERGEFVITDVPAGVHDLEALHPDYTGGRRVNLVISPHLTNELDFNLAPMADAERYVASERLSKTVAVDKSTRTVKGKVLDRKSGKAIGGALVRLVGTGRTILTDSQGEYIFDKVPVGDHQIAASTAGYDTSTFSVGVGGAAPVSEVSTVLAPVSEGGGGSGGPAGVGVRIPGGLNLVAEAANFLKRVHPDKVEILLVETLDLFSHRLDAWLTGLANSRLVECQAENTKSPPIGVYGWLEKPGKLDSTPPEPEFIQAPSVKQATTAAILRNASIHNGTNDNSGAFQINLSSAQVRKGVWYLEGLRQGHLAGELLGYRLERMIHEESRTQSSPIKDKDIFTLREKYPLILHETQDEPDESPSVLTIIDGEKFLDDENTPSKYNEIKARLNQIKDAAADIAVCEAVNADDNIARRGGWLDFLDGESLPPAEEFIRSQRTGDIHGTKVLLQISPPENLEADALATNPRIMADPILAHFCELLMPEFGSKEVVANLTNVDGTQTRPITFFARDLNMDPIDFVIGGFEEIKLRIRYYLLSCWRTNNPTDATSAHPCNILGPFPDFETSDELLNEVGIDVIPPLSSADTLSIFTCIEKAKFIRKLIHQNRSKNSLGTVHPEELPLVNQDQREKLDPLAGLELLSKRLRRIQNQLVSLISRTVRATTELKRRHLILQGLQECRRTAQLLEEMLQSKANAASIDEAVALLQVKIINLVDSDPDLKDLAADAQILDQIDQLKNDENQTADRIEELRIQILDLEKNFSVYIEFTAKAFVTNVDLPLLEISRFGLAKALTIFPDKPTLAASAKIIKLIDQLVSGLIEKLNLLIFDSSDLQNHIQCLKVVYSNGVELNQILHLNRGNQTAANEQLKTRLPLTQAQSHIILTREFQNANYVEPLLSSLLDNINSLNHSFTYYEDYLTSSKIVLEDDPDGVYSLIKDSPSNALEALENTYRVTKRQAEIIIGFNLEDIDRFDVTSIRELIVSTTNSRLTEIISLLQAATDKEGMVILTPYLLNKDNGHRPKWSLDLSQFAGLSGPTYLQEYQEVRPAISNLFELFNVGDELSIFEDKYYQRVDPAEIYFKKEGNTDYLYLTKGAGSPLNVECLTFLLVDQWQEGIPNPDQSEITGVALRYELPQAEAPNAIIIAVPPYKSNTEHWHLDLLANTLLETLELMQIRMVGSHEISNLGQWLPALLFPPTNDGRSLFPTKEQLLHGFDIGAVAGYVLADQLSQTELSKTKAPTIRNEAPKLGSEYEY